MYLLNQVDESKRSEVLSLIKDRSLAIHFHPNPDSNELYYQTFKDLKRIFRGKIEFFSKF